LTFADFLVLSYKTMEVTMVHLIDFVDDNNRFRRACKKPAMTFPLGQDDINEIAEDIDCRLSPENLHCDGEISGAEADSKYVYLHRVFDDLKAHAKENGLDITVKVWEVEA
jgi:hypothetical protein